MSDRLRELRIRAQERQQRMGEAPDTPEQAAETAETNAAMMPLQMQSLAREDAEVRAYVSQLWAEDWDSQEDAVSGP